MKPLEPTIRRLRNEGCSIPEIAERLAISDYRVKVILNPQMRENHRKLQKKYRDRSKMLRDLGQGSAGSSQYYKIKADAEKRLAEIPPDTRDLTGRFFGDPLPERSALYKKQQEQRA